MRETAGQDERAKILKVNLKDWRELGGLHDLRDGIRLGGKWSPGG